MALSALLMLLVLFLGRTSKADVDPTLPFSEYLDSTGNVLLRWGFDLVKDTITFEVTAKTTGWVGLGLSPSGGMAGSDIFIGGVGPDGMYFTVILFFFPNSSIKKYERKSSHLKDPVVKVRRMPTH